MASAGRPLQEGSAFEHALDSAQEYLELQASLGDALRAGFLSLAQARYSMGPDRVSALQFPAHMRATARLRASESGEWELTDASAEPSPSDSSAGSGSWAKADGSAAAAAGSAAAAAGTEAAAASSSEPAAASPAEAESAGEAGGPAGAKAEAGTTVATAAAKKTAEPAVEEQLRKLRLAALESEDLVHQLAAKYGCEDQEGGPDSRSRQGGAAAACPAGAAAGGEPGSAAGQAAEGGDDEEYAEVASPGRPLAWFGSLVAPSLREAEGHFGRALQLAVQAANAQRRLRRGLDAFKAAAQ